MIRSCWLLPALEPPSGDRLVHACSGTVPAPWVGAEEVTWQRSPGVALLPRTRCPADDRRARNPGGSMTGSVVPRRPRRRGLVAVALLHRPRAGCRDGVRRGREGRAVRSPRSGVGTKAALNSPECDKSDGRLAYPYQQRAPCTRPMKKGESNGGATVDGRHQGHDQDRLVRRLPRAAGHRRGTCPAARRRSTTRRTSPRTSKTRTRTGRRCSTTATTSGVASSSS